MSNIPDSAKALFKPFVLHYQFIFKAEVKHGLKAFGYIPTGPQNRLITQALIVQIKSYAFNVHHIAADRQVYQHKSQATNG